MTEQRIRQEALSLLSWVNGKGSYDMDTEEIFESIERGLDENDIDSLLTLRELQAEFYRGEK